MLKYDIRIERNNFGGAWTCGICHEDFHPMTPFSLQIRDADHGGNEVCPACGRKYRPDLQWLLDYFYGSEAFEKFFEAEGNGFVSDENWEEELRESRQRREREKKRLQQAVGVV